MLPDKLHYLLCFYHSIGSFWAVEGGLFRTPSQSAFVTFLFPHLHGMEDNIVSSRILTMVRSNLAVWRGAGCSGGGILGLLLAKVLRGTWALGFQPWPASIALPECGPYPHLGGLLPTVSFGVSPLPTNKRPRNEECGCSQHHQQRSSIALTAP